MATASSKSEQAFIQTGLLAANPLRADGRALLDYRPIALETGVAPLANGSARVSVGGVAMVSGVGGGMPGTDVMAGVKLEVLDVESEGYVEGGRIECAVFCSPSAYPNLLPSALDDFQNDLSTILHQTFSHPSLRPPNLTIVRGKKAWLLHLDVVVLCDAGNVYDACFLACTAALRDTRVPRTRGVGYSRRGGVGAGAVVSSNKLTMKERGGVGMDVDVDEGEGKMSGLDTRAQRRKMDFELVDYWEEGEPLGNLDAFPVCVTLNLVNPVHYLDATLQEESATASRLLLMFSVPDAKDAKAKAKAKLQGMRLVGQGEVTAAHLKTLIRQGEEYARNLKGALDEKVRSEAMRRNVTVRKIVAK